MLEIIARFDSKIRKCVVKLPGLIPAFIYTKGRKFFVKKLAKQTNIKQIICDDSYQKTLWGIKFNTPIFNAAGMFKSGEGYLAMSRQSAGAFLAGTTTSTPRKGNKKRSILHPFLPLPKSFAAINWMGLPNKGHLYTAEKLRKYNKIEGCPIGASISPDPGCANLFAAAGLVEGLFIYENANVDFIEINESCPNVVHGDECNLSILDNSLLERLQFIKENYIDKRNRFVPLIVKFSNDTDVQLVPNIVDTLYNFGFDGVNFGNTSVNYTSFENKLNKKEISLFRKFYKTFGGGASGRPLKALSLNLASEAVSAINKLNPQREFHIFRTGGIESFEDIKASEEAGIAMNQWFTGYFEAFAINGNNLYKKMFNEKKF